MARFELSAEALRDLQTIADHGIDTLGHQRASAYFDLPEVRLGQLARRPQVARTREEPGPGLLSFPHESQLIYFQPSAEGIVVVRILHQRQDAARRFVEDGDRE